MAINRNELVTRHNPVLHEIDLSSPLTVGNGELAFTADVTGLQSLYNEYLDTLPLCTMSTWGWHTKPVSEERYEYTLDDLVMSEYDYNGRRVRYPKKRMPGNEEVYDWLRHNPHRLNLARIGFKYKGADIDIKDLSDIHQELKLYQGLLVSDFKIQGIPCHVETTCHSHRETIAVKVVSEALRRGDLTLAIDFPYGSHDITASDWDNEEAHRTEILREKGDRQGKVNEIHIKRILDRDIYYTNFSSKEEVSFEHNLHSIRIRVDREQVEFTVSFSPKEIAENLQAAYVFKNAKEWWYDYWEKGGIVQLNKSKDPRALELERRIILSQYLLAINSCGSTPPQETGLTCNSWYGKMHLEMYLWHCAWAPLWHQTKLLERSLPWYVDHIKEAKENAGRNGYKGSRWPKMIATEGIDCPSPVAPLLVWQQPHIIFMLDLAYRQNGSMEFMEKYWTLIEETAKFMVDFVVFNEETGRYDIVPPVIPVQECHRHDISKNPAFEVEYWRYTLKIAVEWAKRLGKDYDQKWQEVADNMAELPIANGLYIAHDNCPDTYEEYKRDHPSMLMAYGLLPSDRVNKDIMADTLSKVIASWDYPSLWGWDFAVMAMTATRLGKADTAIDILLIDTLKNDYVKSGHNRQISRKDLPLYLPGNGSILLALPMMVAGYEGCTEDTPGFPKDGMWTVEFENIQRYV